MPTYSRKEYAWLHETINKGEAGSNTTSVFLLKGEVPGPNGANTTSGVRDSCQGELRRNGHRGRP